MKLTILIPVYNEQKHLAEVLKRVVGQFGVSALSGRYIKSVELICIDDASKDGSREWLESLRNTFEKDFGHLCPVPCEYRLILQAKNQGKGAAIRTGIDASTGDILLIQDADLEYSPSDYDGLLRPLIKNEADACYGSRFVNGSNAKWLSVIQAFANKFLTWFFNFMSSTKLTDVETCYKVMKGDLARSLRLGSNRFGIELELTARLSRIGARIIEVGISYDPRTYLEGKKIGPSDGVAALFHIVRYNVLDTHPYKTGKELKNFAMRPRLRTIALGIFLAALTLRLAFVMQWLKTPYAGSPLLDAKAYDAWAQSILDGNFVRDRAFYQSPLYPYLLALLYKLAGQDFLIISFLQAILGALTCGILAWMTALYMGELAGVMTGLLAVLYRPLIFYTAPAMKETLGLFLLALFILQLLGAFTKNRRRDFFTAGLLLGLTALARGNALALAPIAALASLIKWRRAGVLSTLVFTVGVSLAVLPATIHNWIASRDLVMLNYTGGFDFYMGNSPTASGANAYPPNVSSEPAQEEQDVTRIAEADVGKALKPSEVSHYWYSRAMDFIVQHPGEELAAMLNKVLFFFNDFEQPDNYDISFITANLETLLGWPLVSFGIVLTLSVFGFAACWNDEKRKQPTQVLFWLGLAYAASVLLFYVTDRYRLPIVIFLMPLAGAATPRIVTLMRARRWSSIGWAGAAVVPFALLAFVNVASDRTAVEAFDWGALAGAYADQRQDQEAVAALKKGLSLDAKSVDAEALVKVSTSEERQGHLREAEELLRIAAELHPNDGFAPYNYGRFKLEHGQTESALTYFRRASEVMPWQYQPYLGLSLALLRLGRAPEAMEAAKKGLAINPASPELIATMRQLLALGQASVDQTRAPAESRSNGAKSN